MEQFLLSLLRHIAYNFPQLSLVAEDCGQLETQEDNYPVTFPCVLVGNTDIDWSDLDEQGSSQRGTATITVRLAIDCYDDVHIGSTQESSIAERYRLPPISTTPYKVSNSTTSPTSTPSRASVPATTPSPATSKSTNPPTSSSSPPNSPSACRVSGKSKATSPFSSFLRRFFALAPLHRGAALEW